MSDNLLTSAPSGDNQAPAPATSAGPPADGQFQITPPTSWRDSLPEDIRGEKVFDNFKGQSWDEVGPTLAKGYAHAQRMVGGSIRLPAKDAPPEEFAALRTRLSEAGVIEAPPPAPDKYTAKINLPEGHEADPGMTSRFYKVAHEHGLSDKQAQAMLDLYVEQAGAAKEKLGGSAAETMAELEKEYGGATQQYLRQAQRAVSDVGGKDLIDVLDRTGLGNHPALVKAFIRVGKMMAEDDPIFADTTSGGGETAQAEIAKILANPDDLYHAKFKGRPGHEERVRYVTRLYEQAYPPAV